MSAAHWAWLSTESADSPMILTFLRSNSGLIFARYPSSVVQTGVKSLGCENSTAHESPIHSWKLIGPSVVSAWKSGALSPMASVIVVLLLSRMVLCVSRWNHPGAQNPHTHRAGPRERPGERECDTW